MIECKPLSTPMASIKSLSLFDGEVLSDPTSYRSIVGALKYCTTTCPVLNFAVNKVYQFMHSSTTVHLNAIKRILWYLKGTISHGISFQASSNLSLTCFTDVDWASCPNEKKSTSGYCCFLGSNLIPWSSSKQRVVSRSSAKSEYRDLANAAVELIWIEALLTVLDYYMAS